MIAPIRTQTASRSRTSSGHDSAEPLRFCEVRRGADAVPAVGGGDRVDDDVGVAGGVEVAGEVEAGGAVGVVVAGAPDGLSGNC
jgi:hypothetical protein